MTCRAHRGTLLDLARGVAMPAPVEDAASAHVRACPACAAELERQRDLTRALQVLSDSTPAAPGASLEARLLAAFPSRDEEVRETGARRGRAGWWIGAAAALALVVAGAWFAGSYLPANAGSHATPPGDLSAETGSQGTDRRALPAEAGSHGNDRRALPAEAGSRATVRGEAANRAPIGGRVAYAFRRRERLPKPPTTSRAPAVRDVEFVTIPTAIGLPPLESATIVRTELPLSALPDYGIQIVPNAAHAVLEADLLVGQDGLPRGIRLVTANDEASTPRSR